MKKSTIAVAALLSALSTAPVVSVAYADDAAPANGSAATPSTDGSNAAPSSDGSTPANNCSSNCGSNCGSKSEDE
ncbi:hypothetical protein [Legionella sp. km772]|uniref:hypothetical protein n=1 Tax=Legionella sp. km772 TaxID=2498111 RepID=UPI000F8E2470|nr:hypothetical protein [Legionella sp. km772]RUR05696.1 hypothetical protein ELY15_14020 [Legionella sp. km772]